MKCQSCGAEIPDGSLFCRECGAKIEEKKRFCRVCGAELGENNRFCTKCGASVELSDATAAVNEELAEPVINGFKVQEPEKEAEEEKTVTGEYHETEKSKAGEYRPDATAERGNKSAGFSVPKLPTLSKKTLLIVFLAALVVIFVAVGVGLLSSKGTTSDNEEPAEQVHNTIEKGSEYSFKCDDDYVYIAKAAAEDLIKIEKWEETFLFNENMQFDKDIGTYYINDAENHFRWADDEQTAFYMDFSDGSYINSKLPIVFTRNVTSDDWNKGTNCEKEVASYLYKCDEKHHYKAVLMTDGLVKIECWYRSGSLGTFKYSWDVDVFKTNDEETGFRWTDGEHTSFTITTCDPQNSSYWKEPTLVLFEIDNSEYKYETVYDYLLAKATEPSSESSESSQSTSKNSSSGSSVSSSESSKSSSVSSSASSMPSTSSAAESSAVSSDSSSKTGPEASSSQSSTGGTTISFQEAVGVIRDTIASNGYAYSDVSGDEKKITIKLAGDSVTKSAIDQLMQYGYDENTPEWKDCRDAMTKLAAGSKDGLAMCGFNNTAVEVILVDETNHSTVLLKTNGTSVTYDYFRDSKSSSSSKASSQNSQGAETTSQKNAVKMAKNYMSIMPFSRSGLIGQLEYEGFSTSDATYAVDSLNANWNEQAAKMAQNYVSIMAFSRSGLIEQLEYEGFTYSQAEYGVTAVGY